MLVNTHEAKTHLSRLIERAVDGEEIIIGKAGKPLVRLVPFRAEASPRAPGAWRGKVWLSADFDDPSSDVIAAFEGE
jgi:prevent-host-death family protein